MTARLRGWVPVLTFGLKFCALMALYYVVVLVPFVDRLFFQYLRANAWLSGAIVNLFGQACQVTDVTLRSGAFAISVRRGCDALEPAWFFCAAVLSFPAPFARKLPGVLAGSAVILLLNLARIVSLFFLGLRSPGLFDAAHLEVWPAVFIVAAIVLWAAWICWARKGARSRPDHDAP
jgi:exosortase/archaeosortase family protein